MIKPMVGNNKKSTMYLATELNDSDSEESAKLGEDENEPNTQIDKISQHYMGVGDKHSDNIS